MPRAVRRSILAGLVVIHCGLLAWSGWRDSFTPDEPRHLVAGISHWQLGNFDLFRVNPPLIRMTAVIPVLFASPELDWSDYSTTIFERPEVAIGRTFLERNRERTFFLLALARWACTPFSLLGLLVCYCWAKELFGDAAGLLAAALWCFEPNILAHAHLISPDVGAAALGLAACYAFRRWLLSPDWGSALVAGIVFGLAQLAKTTWIMLFGLWPLVWLSWRISERRERRTRWLRDVAQLATMFVAGLWLLNAAYGFEGSFQRVGEYHFLSTALSGHQETGIADNRFTGTVLGNVPVPLPGNYVQGIDRQKHHFEWPDWSYLGGEWRERGWYHYYIYAMLVKVPLGIWLLGFAAVFLAVNGSRPADGTYSYRSACREELLLLVPMIAVLVLVSSQTGFNRHLRYVLPAFPFGLILISRVGRVFGSRVEESKGRRVAGKNERSTFNAQHSTFNGSEVGIPHPSSFISHPSSGSRGRPGPLRVTARYAFRARSLWLRAFVAICVAWSIASSLFVYPHSLSYFNELAGGPRNGHAHLLSSNIDWGQDLLYLKRWYDAHPGARPLHVGWQLSAVDPRIAGIKFEPVPTTPIPGWHAVSVSQLRSQSPVFRYLLEVEPVAMAGYSIYIYHLTEGDCKALRARARRVREQQ